VLSSEWQQPLMEEAPIFKKVCCVHVALRILAHHAFNYDGYIPNLPNLYNINLLGLGKMKLIEQWL
jgi:hypothetical protein